MTYEEMLQDTIERIQQADAADLSAIHDYLVWNESQHNAWAPPKVPQEQTEKQQLEKIKKLEEFLT